MYYLLAFFFLLIAFFLYGYFEASFLEVKRINLTKNANCLRILQLSDIHYGRLRISQEKIRSVISKEQPDIILITGDCIENAKDSQGFMDFVSHVKGDFTTLLCLGNHDYKSFNKDTDGLDNFVDSLEKIGVRVLEDQCLQYQKDNQIYNIIGFKDISTGNPNLRSALKGCDKDATINIGFSHNPDIVFRIPRGCVSYLLCGHFHGGQIWAPFNFEFRILRKEKLCKMGIKRGLHKVRGINLYINRGLGNVIVPLRFFSRPEITLFYIP